MKRLVAAALVVLFAGSAEAQPVRKAVGKVRQATRQAVCTLTGGCAAAGGFWAPSGMASPAPFVAVPAEAPKPMAAQAPKIVGAPGDRIIRLAKKLQIVRGKIVDGLVAKGVDRSDAEKVVGELGDGTLLRLILEHLDDIAAIILKLLPLFMDKVAVIGISYVDPPVDPPPPGG